MNDEMPVGLGMALAQNITAMNHFATLSPSQQQQIIAGAQRIGSREEMHRYVQRIARGNPFQ